MLFKEAYKYYEIPDLTYFYLLGYVFDICFVHVFAITHKGLSKNNISLFLVP